MRLCVTLCRRAILCRRACAMVDEAKLKSLRDLYRDAKGGEMHDPHFRKVAESLFQDGERRKWPFADVATLLDAPHRPDAPSLADYGGLEIALIGVPMD